MIYAQDAAALGQLLCQHAAENPLARLRFLVDPGRVTAIKQPAAVSPIPLLTGHGNGDALGEVIHSFHQWGRPINIGMIQAEGICEFWVEPDACA